MAASHRRSPGLYPGLCRGSSKSFAPIRQNKQRYWNNNRTCHWRLDLFPICPGLLLSVWANPLKSGVLEDIKHFKKSDTTQVRAVRALKRTPSHYGSQFWVVRATAVLLFMALHKLPAACLLRGFLLRIHS